MMLPENVLQNFEATALRLGDLPCLKYKKHNVWHSLSWLETLDLVKKTAEGLKQLGVKKGDRVSILSSTRYEWTLADMAILSLGAITVPIYQSTLEDEALHILSHSGAKLVFAEDKKQLAKINSIRAKLKNLEKVILITGKSTEKNIVTFKELQKLGSVEEIDFSERIQKIRREDLATLVYTSGTTGMPKGVMLVHDNLVKEIDAIQEIVDLGEKEESLIFLPLAHILARAVQFFQLSVGFTHAYAESIDKLGDNIKEIRPHFLVSVPRIFEKIYNKVTSDVDHASALKKAIFHWALRVGLRVAENRRLRRRTSLLDAIQYKLAYQLVFSKLHERLGGRVRFFVSGGAPLSQEIAEFFAAAGLIILEGYGLTETTGAINANSLEDYEFGTVGSPVKYVEQKIAHDGEILVRGGPVSQGYYNNPEANGEAFEDGWFKTGDIGEVNEKGHLKITDRKKDLIVTAGGKNVAPQNIENLIKGESLISQVMVHGDKRKYLSALLTLNEEELKSLAPQMGLNGASYGELVKNPKVFEHVKKIIDKKNKQLPSYETIKKFAILDQDFTVENGALTPSLKVKRKFITGLYQEVLDSFYRD